MAPLSSFAPLVFLLLVIGCTARPFYPLPSKGDGGSRKPLQTLRPYNIAHRGSNGEIPEATHPAYTRAIEEGADFIETDILSSKDGVLICFHDVTLDDTTDIANYAEFANRKRTYEVQGENITGFFTVDFTLKELKSLRVTLFTKGTHKAENATMIKQALCFLVFLHAFHQTHAVQYSVTNRALTTSGGVVFRDEIGDAYAKQILDSATQFIWRIFQQSNPADRKNVQTVSLFVDDIDGVAYTSGDEIHLSARYVELYSSYGGDVKKEISGVLYHEMVHVWQWDGNGGVPGGLVEGIADYVRLKANYAPSHWVKPGEGQKWDQGYDVTARFLEYCESLRSGFVAQLNKLSRSGYSDQYFVYILGKPVDQLWQDYKAKYGNLPYSI